MYIGLALILALSALSYVALRKLGEADEHDRQTEADFGITER